MFNETIDLSKFRSVIQTLCLTVILTITSNVLYAQGNTETSYISHSDFTHSKGIWVDGKDLKWQERFASPIVIDSSILFNKSLFNVQNVQGPIQEPFVQSDTLDLARYCGVNLGFDVFTEQLNPNAIIYVEVSSDAGHHYELIEELREWRYLSSEIQIFQDSVVRFNFPIRTALTDSMIIRIHTNLMSNEDQLYIDNVSLTNKSEEDNLIAFWDFAYSDTLYREIDTTLYSERVAVIDEGHCIDITASEIIFNDRIEYNLLSGYNEPYKSYDPEHVNHETGAICVKASEVCELEYITWDTLDRYFDPTKELQSLIFNVKITPNQSGQIHGLSFMERSLSIQGDEINNYPTKYGIKIFKNGNLIFSQKNMTTTSDWTEEYFRFSHIEEMRIFQPANFTFQLIPYCPVGIESEVSLWDIDEIKVMGGCCIDCGSNSIGIAKKTSNESAYKILYPIINLDNDDCFNFCEGSITNEGCEAISPVTHEPYGWSCFAGSKAIPTSDMLFDREFKSLGEYTFELGVYNGDTLDYIKTDMVDLCIGELYQICFDHIEYMDTLLEETLYDSLALFTDLRVEVGNKEKDFKSSLNRIRNSCMTFTATDTTEQIRLYVIRGIDERVVDNRFYLDNLKIEHIKDVAEDKFQRNWIKPSISGYNNDSIIPDSVYSFDITEREVEIKDTVEMYKNRRLYQVCFDHYEALDSNLRRNEIDTINSLVDVKLTIDNRIYKYIKLPYGRKDSTCITSCSCQWEERIV